MNKQYLALAIVLILILPVVTALEFDNVKYYDEATKTVTIENGFGFGDKIAEVKLNTPLHYKVPLGYQKVAEFTITSYNDYNNALKELELFDKRNGMNKFIRAYDYKYLTYEDIVIDDYETTCIKKQYVNGSNYDDCTSNVIGSHTEQREKWIKLTPADLKKNDIITIGIFTEVQNKDLVEWIPNMFGVRVNEWATFEGSLLTGLQAYYSLENSAEDIYGSNDGVLTLGGYDINGKRDVGINTSTDGVNFNTTYNQSGGDLTVNFWLKSTAVAGDGNTVMCFRSDYPCGTTPTGAGHLQFYWGGSGNGFHADFFDGSRKQAQKNEGWTLNAWHMISLITNSTSVVVYIDAVNGTQTAASFTPIGIANIISLQLSGFSGIIQQDEVMIWNRSLTQTELTTLYDSGTGTFYTANTAPTVTLNAPADYTNQTGASLTFNWTAFDDVNVTNSTLYINGVVNQTIQHGTSNSTNEQVTLNFGDGSYNWTVTAEDDVVATGTTDTRFFTIDGTAPSVSIVYPSTNITDGLVSSKTKALDLNFTASDSGIGLDTCWFYNISSGLNTTLTCGTNTTLTLAYGNNYTFRVYANDSLGNLGTDSITISLTSQLLSNTNTFNSTTFETKRESFINSINRTSGTTLTAALWYNGTSYAVTSASSGTNYNFTKTFASIPLLSTANVGENRSFHFEYTLDGSSINSSTYYQYVKPMNVTQCSSGHFINITAYDETDDTIVPITFETDWDYYIGDGSIYRTLTYDNNTHNTPYLFCTGVNTESLILSGTGLYKNDSYPQRRFDFSGAYPNGTVNITKLYLLSSSDGIYTTFQVLTAAEQPIEGVSATVERQFSGVWTQIDAGTTGGDGGVTFWVNPDYSHRFTFSKTGYTSTITTLTPTQSSYTVYLGGGNAIENLTTLPNHAQGILFTPSPNPGSINANTTYNFTLNLSSSYWTVDSWGYTIKGSGFTITTNSSTAGTGGSLTSQINIASNSTIIMYPYWVINSTTYNSSIYTWNVIAITNKGYGIKTFFTNFGTYMDAGMFGATAFTKYLIVFLFMFLLVGFITYSFGIVDMEYLIILIGAMVIIFDAVLGLLPPPQGMFSTMAIIAIAGVLINSWNNR